MNINSVLLIVLNTSCVLSCKEHMKCFLSCNEHILYVMNCNEHKDHVGFLVLVNKDYNLDEFTNHILCVVMNMRTL